MPDNKKYLIEIPGQQGVAYWGSERYNANKDDLMKDHPDAIVYEVGQYNAEDINDKDMFSISIPKQEGSALWDSQRFSANSADLLNDYPNAKIQRLRPVDYWEEQRSDLKRQLMEYDAQYGAFLSDYEAKREMEKSRGLMNETMRSTPESEYILDNAREYAIRNKEREALLKAIHDNPREQEEKNALYDSINALSETLDKQGNDNYRNALNQFVAEGGNIAMPGADAVIRDKAENGLYNGALRFLESAKETLEAPSKYDNSNGFVNFMKGAGHTLGSADFWTMGMSTIMDNLNARQSFEKIWEKFRGVDIEKLTPEQIDEKLTPGEKAMVEAFTKKAQADAARAYDLSLGYQSGMSAAESLGFMAQFALTGGVTSTAAKGATKWAAKRLARGFSNMASKGVSKGMINTLKAGGKFALGTTRSLIDAAVRTGMTTTAPKSISEQLLPNIQENTLPEANIAVLKGLGDAFIENWSEAYGEVLGAVMNAPLRALFPEWSKAIAKAPMMQFAERAGFNGYLTEIGEEWFGNAMRSITNVDPDALKNFATVDNQLVTMVAFLPMTLIGGGVSMGQMAAAEKTLENKTADLRYSLEKAGLNMDEIDALVDYRQALSPQMLSDRFTPIITRLANMPNNRALTAELFKSAGAFSKAVARYQTMQGGYQSEMQNANNALRDEMVEKMGGNKFWNTRQSNAKNENGEAYEFDEVQVVTNVDGSRFFVVGQVGDQLATVDEEGNTGVITQQELEAGMESGVFTSNKTMMLDQFLAEDNILRRRELESQRMNEDRAVQIHDLRAKYPTGSAVNLGTRVNPISGFVAQYTANGVVIRKEDNTFVNISYEQFAQAVNSPIRVLTDEQIASEEAALIEAKEAEKETELADTPEDMTAAEETADASAEFEQVAAPSIVPMNEDGTVNEQKFLEDNPEEYISWNDNNRQDGGADSKEQLEMLIPVYQNKYNEAAQGWAANAADPVARRAAKESMAEWKDKIDRINALLLQYNAPVQAEQNLAERTVQAELEDLHDGTLNDAEIESNIDAHIAEAQNAYDEYVKTAPQMGTDRNAYRQAKTEFEEGLKALEQELNYWNEVKKANENYRKILSGNEIAQMEERRLQAIKDRVGELEKALGIGINVIERAEDVTNEEAKREIDKGESPMGWYNVESGRVELYLPAIGSAQLAEETIIHEVVGHKGLRGLLGEKQFNNLLDSVYKHMEKSLNANELHGWLHYPGVNEDKRKAADEYLAHLAEKVDYNEERTTWNRIVGVIKDFLRRLGLDVNMNDSDLVDIIKRSYARLKENAVNTLVENGYNEEEAEGEDIKFKSTSSQEAVDSVLGEQTTMFKFIGEKGTANLDKAEEATIRIDNLGVARQMEEAGKDAKAIKLATGWERGVDKLWRYEVADDFDLAELENRLQENLNDGLSKTWGVLYPSDLGDLTKAYPDFNVDIVVWVGDEFENTGEYSPATEGDETTFGRPASIEVKAKTVADIKDVLVHEIQHAIQEKEGFAEGGSVFGLKDKLSAELDKRVVRIKELRAEGRDAEADELMSMSKGLAEAVINNDADIYQNYRKLAGEVEARNVSARLKMSEQERRESLLLETEDVAHEDQIVLMDGLGVSEMGSRVDKRMLDIENELSGTTMTEAQNTVYNVFIGKQDKQPITVQRKDGVPTIIMEQGADNKSGAKHAIFKHYGTGSGSFTAKDVLLIPEIVNNGTRKQDGNKVVYELTKDGIRYRVVTYVKTGNEIFNNFYTNRKNQSSQQVNAQKSDTQSALASEELASADKDTNKSDTTNDSGGNTFWKTANGSLVGMHNISEQKLKKALKQGGLANPSAAVIDIDKQDHTGYGDISFIMPSSLVDAYLGKNAGTFTADAWTPTYPQVSKRFSDTKGQKKYWKDIEGIPEEMQHEVRMAFDSWTEDRNSSGLAYMFLQERNEAPELVRVPARFSDELKERLSAILGADKDSFHQLSEEQKQEVLDLYIQQEFNGNREEFDKSVADTIARIEDRLSTGKVPSFVEKRITLDLQWLKEHGYNYDNVSNFVRDIVSDIRHTSEVNPTATTNRSIDYIKENGLEKEFEQWKEGLAERYGIKEYLWGGYTPSGNQRWLPNTIENASKLMNKEGLAAATGSVGFNRFVASLAPNKKYLSQIKAAKKNLTEDQKAVDEFREKWSEVYYDLGIKCQPDAGKFEDYGLARLQEAAQKKNPGAYLKKEYGVELSQEDLQKLDEMIKAIKEDFPARYFETKFQRPVYLNEFAAAVMPTTTSEDIKQAVSEAGLPIYEYDSVVEGSRREATLKATESGDVRFKTTIKADLDNNGISIDNEALMSEYGLSSIELSKRENYVTLSKIVVSDKGKGNGTRFMNDLVDLADENGWILALTPDTAYGASSISRLKKFYKQFGFKENKGRNTDFNTKESMVRVPEQNTMFKTRMLNQSVANFLNEVVPEFESKYNIVAPATIMKLPTMSALAKALKLDVSEISDEMYEDFIAKWKRAYATYAPVTNEDESFRHNIIIFAHNEFTTSFFADTALFHENIHGFVMENEDLLKLGTWLYENANQENGIAFVKPDVDKYPESERHEEMLTHYVSAVMALGFSQRALDIVSEEYKPLLNYIYERFGYNPETEDGERRKRYVSERNEVDGRTWTDRPSVQVAKGERKVGSGATFFKTAITPEVRKEMDAISAQAIVNGNYLKAPNGKDTKLTPEQWALVRTRNFLNWFGDWINDPENASKVVDENGEPKVVYHQTNAVVYINRETGENWDELDWRARQEWDERDDWEDYWEEQDFNTFSRVNARTTNEFDGFFFAPEYDEYHEYGKRTIPAFLNIKNPASNEDYNIDSTKNNAGRDERLRLQNEGFDGVIRMEGEDVWEYVAFSPNQIKSATENNGEYSEREDIRFKTRTKPAPQNVKEVYKLMRLGADGRLYPLYIDSAEGIELKVWYDADSPNMGDIENLEVGYAYKIDKNGNVVEKKKFNKTARGSYSALPTKEQIDNATLEESRWVAVSTYADGSKAFYNVGVNGSGTSSLFGMRPGWHAGSLPTMRQIGKGSKKNLRDDSFVWVRGYIPADVDYQAEADANSSKDIQTHIPTDGYYLKATNANKKASQADKMGWYIAGAFYADEIISDAEARSVIDEWNKEHPDAKVEYDFPRESGREFDPARGGLVESGTMFKTNPVTYDNFNKETAGVWEIISPSEVPNRKEDYASTKFGAPDKVSSRYWYGTDENGDFVIRESDHWSVYLHGENSIKDFMSNPMSRRYTPIASVRWAIDMRPATEEGTYNKVKPEFFKDGKAYGKIYLADLNQIEDTMFKTDPSTMSVDELVEQGLTLSVEEFTDLAANIYKGLPENVRRNIINAASKNDWDLKKATFQMIASLAGKSNLTDEEIETAKMITDKVQDAILSKGTKISRPFTVNEVLWMLYKSTNPVDEMNPFAMAERAMVANNLGFSPKAKEAESEDESEIRFKKYIVDQSVSAADAYTQAISYWGNRMNEAFVDQYDAVDHLMKAIEDATGKKAESWEDIRLLLTQSASKGLAKLQEVERELIQKMWDAVNEFAKIGVNQERLARYVILKHGLERNELFARRDARRSYEEEYRDEVKRIKKDSALTNDEKKQKIDEAQEVLDNHIQDIEAQTDERYLENRKQDYSGILAMFAEYPGLMSADNYSTEEEYKTARRKSRVQRFKKLAKAEKEAQKEIDAFEDSREVLIKNLWDSINKLTKGTLKMQYDYGMLSNDSYISLSGMFKYYVPLRGFSDNTGEDLYDYYSHNVSDGYAPAVMGAKGRKSEAESPFGWMAAMAATAVVSGEKNLAKQALYYFTMNRKSNDLLKVAEVWYIQSPTDEDMYYPAYPPQADPNNTPAENAQQYAAWEAQMEKLRKEGKAIKKTNRLDVAEVVNFGKKDAPEHIIKININGEEKQLIVNANPRAAQAINGLLNMESNPDYQKVLGKVLRWMSQVSTGWNPEFWMTNITRDTITAFSAINIKEDKTYRDAFAKNWAEAWKLVKMLPKFKDGTLGTGRLEDLLREAVENGVQTGYSHIKPMEEWDRDMNKYLKELNKEEGKVVTATKNFIDGVQTFSESMELVSRFATYITSRQLGRDVTRSVSDAKEVTVNFNRKGSGMRITFDEAKKLKWADGTPIFSEKWKGFMRLKGLAAVTYVSGMSALAPFGRKYMMFFNAGVQGLNMWLQMYRNGFSKQVNLLAGTAFALGILNSVIQGILDGDDDDYQQSISDYERRSNLMLGANGYYLKFALPQELKAFYGLGDILYNYAAGNYHHKDTPVEIFRTAANQLVEILPINPMGGWQEWIPSMGRAVVEAGLAVPFLGEVIPGTNENFAGSPLRDEKKWLSEAERESMPQYAFATNNTWSWLVGLAELANRATGGSEYDAGWLQLDPARIQHYAEQATGGLGGFVGKIVSSVNSALDPEMETTVTNIPFLNKVFTVADERGQNKLTNEQFYYYKGVAEAAEMRYDKYMRESDREKSREERQSDEHKIMKIFFKYEGRDDAYKERLKRAKTKEEERELKEKRDANRKRFIDELAEKGLL